MVLSILGEAVEAVVGKIVKGEAAGKELLLFVTPNPSSKQLLLEVRQLQLLADSRFTPSTILEQLSGKVMGYFAHINDLGIVEEVISINNLVLGEPANTFPGTEPIGVDFISNTLQLGGVWKQTSYNKSFRKNYAGIGYSYDSTRDAFIAPKPYASWILDEESCTWKTPIERPEGAWYWDEETISWKEITNDIN
jgi:hypothetical protein